MPRRCACAPGGRSSTARCATSPASRGTAQPIELLLNAGLLIDLPHIEETGAAGIGLFRTELQFMVGAALPRASEQLALYRAVLDAAGDKPVTFRTLDIGGDKIAALHATPSRRRIRRSAGARSASASTGRACCAARSARCCAPAAGAR